MENDIIYLSYYWPPVGNPAAYRAWHLCRNLARFGWNVHVFAAHGFVYRHRDFFPSDGPNPAGPGVVNVTRTFSANFALPRPLRKILMYGNKVDAEWSWEGPTRRAIEKRLAGMVSPVMISSSYPYTSHFIARSLKSRYRIPWIAELLDPWIGNFEGETRPEAVEWERQTLREADRVVVVNPEMIEIVAKGDAAIRSKARVITDGYDEADFADLQPLKVSTPSPTLLFTGTLYKAYGASARKVASIWNEITGGSLVFVGCGFRALAASGLHSQPHVVRTSRVPVYQARRYEAGADYFLLITPPGSDYVSTSKVYQYLRHGKPLIVVGETRGALPRTLSEARVPHVVLPYGSEDRWHHMLKEWISQSHSCGSPTSYVQSFEWRALTRTLENIIRETSPRK